MNVAHGWLAIVFSHFQWGDCVQPKQTRLVMTRIPIKIAITASRYQRATKQLKPNEYDFDAVLNAEVALWERRNSTVN